MAELPKRPIAASEFFEGFVPEAVAKAGLPESLRDLEITLGVRLEGPGGGEWLAHLEGGSLLVEAASRERAAFTLVQSVEDWRGALWEGRGGAVGRRAAALLRPGTGKRSSSRAGLSLAPAREALLQMQQLDAMLRVVVTGGEGGDWSIALRLGPGPIPGEPHTTVCVDAEDIDAMERGDLGPLEAFMAGRIQVAGDMALVLQIQAIQMQAGGA